MGLNYVLFRIWFLLQKKTGLLVKRFPANPPFFNAITLVEWKKSIFFIKSKEELTFPKNKVETLKNEAESILNGDYLFFSSTKFTLGLDYDWVSNPDTGFKYDISKHQDWLEYLDSKIHRYEEILNIIDDPNTSSDNIYDNFEIDELYYLGY
jgi:hypothetical protein